jgi:hypothetical protein
MVIEIEHQAAEPGMIAGAHGDRRDADIGMDRGVGDEQQRQAEEWNTQVMSRKKATYVPGDTAMRAEHPASPSCLHDPRKGVDAGAES